MVFSFTKRIGKQLLVYSVFSVCALSVSKESLGQCNVAAETNTAFSAASGCNNGNFNLGSGAYYDLGVIPNTFYVFTWNNNGAPNINGFCANPNNGSGSAFTTNQTNWFSGSTTSLRVSSNRSSGTWSGTSALMTYKQTTPDAAMAVAAPTTVCTGTQVTITGSGGANGTLYFQNTTSGGTNTATTANPQNLIPPVGSTTYYWRSNNSGCWGTEGGATVSVSANTIGGTASASAPSVCIGSTVGISLAGYLGTINNWEGRFNSGAWGSIGNAGMTSFTSVPLNNVGTYEFRAAVVNAPCNGAYSSIISVTVVPATVPGTAAPAIPTFCSGGNTTVSLSGNTGNVVSWELNINGAGWNSIGNANLTTIPTGILTTPGAYQYRANVQNAPCGVLQSTIAVVNVDAVSVGGNASASGTLICDGDNPTVSLTNQTGGVLYWERQVNGGGFNNIGNAGLTTFSTGALSPGVYDYRAVVQNGTCSQATSTSVSITVSSPTVGGSAVPQIGVLCQGSSTNVNLSGQTGAILNWEQQVNGGGWSSIGNPGLTVIGTGALNSPGINEFRAVIQNGGCPATESTPATITVDPTSVGGTVIANFTSVCAGSTVDMILSGQTGAVVNWERQYNGGGWTNVGNAGSTLFTSSALTPAGTYEFRAVVQSGTCSPVTSSSVSITVIPYDNATFSYSSSVFCQGGGTNPSPSIAQGGGTFTASPAGLDIDASNGIISLGSSAPGSYTVTYTTSGVCPSTANQSVTVVGSGNANFSYSNLSYCLDGANPIPTATTPGGTYSSSPAGIIFVNASTGEIDMNLSVSGSYYVTYTLPGTCPSSVTQTVDLFDPGNATFAYQNSSYCLGGTNPSPSIAQFGGTFSAAPFGLVFTNNQTGTIDLASSTAGTYTITYNTGGICPSTVSQTITLNAAGDPLFFYSNSTFCQNATNPVPFVATAGGGFTASPAGLFFANPATGEIDLTTSVPGGYVVTYNTGGLCPTTYSQNVLVSATQNATFTYGQSSYCSYDANPTPSVAQIGGTFTSSPSGLVFENQLTGKIDLAASTSGTYTVTYTVPGPCPGVYSQQVTINNGAIATVSYAASSFCSNDTDPLATVSPAGGTFTTSPLGLSINTSGTIDLSASVPGAYTVSYTAAGVCGTTASTNVIVVTSPQAFIQPINTLCTASPSTILTASPAGGTWSGGAYINTNGTFDPSVSGAGTFPVNYTVSGSGGCNASATYNVVVNASPVVTITPAGPFCSNDSIEVLTASPLGGMWSGNPFVSINGLFFPTEAGPGVYPVMYTVNNGACTGSAIASVQVLSSPTPTINAVGTLCENSAAIGLTSSISGGTWSGGAYVSSTGTFTPALAAVGNNTVTYTVVNGPCTAQASAQIAVNANPNVSILNPFPFCENDAPEFLLVNFPGGVFSGGPFVSGTGLFDPSLATSGSNTVVYTLTASNGCVGSDTANVLVNPNPDATITYPGLLCEDDAAFALTAATPGGTWSGGAYVNNGIFDPAVSGPGSFLVAYDVTSGGCSASSSVTVTVGPNPLAAYIYQPNGLFAYFTDFSLNVDSWLWNFGDGSPEVSTQNPTHEFPDNGVYQVRLIAFNDCGSDTLILPVYVNKTVSIEENTATAEFTLYPNPADQYITIKGSQLGIGEWKLNILDISGKQVSSEMIYTEGELNHTADISQLKPGVYFIHMTNGQQQAIYKFIKI